MTARVLNKILANQIGQHVKRIMYIIMCNISKECRLIQHKSINLIQCFNRKKDQKPHDLNRHRKSTRPNATHFHLKRKKKAQ